MILNNDIALSAGRELGFPKQYISNDDNKIEFSINYNDDDNDNNNNTNMAINLNNDCNSFKHVFDALKESISSFGIFNTVQNMFRSDYVNGGLDALLITQPGICKKNNKEFVAVVYSKAKPTSKTKLFKYRKRDDQGNDSH